MNAAVQALLSNFDADIVRLSQEDPDAISPSAHRAMILSMLRPMLFTASQVEATHQDLCRMNLKFNILITKINALSAKLDRMEASRTLDPFINFGQTVEEIFDMFFVGAAVEQLRGGAWEGIGVVSDRFNRGNLVEVHVTRCPGDVSVHLVENTNELRLAA